MRGLLLYQQTPHPEIARTLRAGDVIDVLVHEVCVDREKLLLQLLPDAAIYELRSRVPSANLD